MSRLAFDARRATGLSQRAFARLLDVHPATITRWETGARQPAPAVRTLLRLIVTHTEVRAALLHDLGPPRG